MVIFKLLLLSYICPRPYIFKFLLLSYMPTTLYFYHTNSIAMLYLVHKYKIKHLQIGI